MVFLILTGGIAWKAPQKLCSPSVKPAVFSILEPRCHFPVMSHAIRINKLQEVENGIFSTSTGITLEESRKRVLAEEVMSSTPCNPQKVVFVLRKKILSARSNPARPSLNPV